MYTLKYFLCIYLQHVQVMEHMKSFMYAFPTNCGLKYHCYTQLCSQLCELVLFIGVTDSWTTVPNSLTDNEQ